MRQTLMELEFECERVHALDLHEGRLFWREHKTNEKFPVPEFEDNEGMYLCNMPLGVRVKLVLQYEADTIRLSVNNERKCEQKHELGHRCRHKNKAEHKCEKRVKSVKAFSFLLHTICSLSSLTLQTRKNTLLVINPSSVTHHTLFYRNMPVTLSNNVSVV